MYGEDELCIKLPPSHLNYVSLDLFSHPANPHLATEGTYVRSQEQETNWGRESEVWTVIGGVGWRKGWDQEGKRPSRKRVRRPLVCNPASVILPREHHDFHPLGPTKSASPTNSERIRVEIECPTPTPSIMQYSFYQVLL